MRRRSTCVVQPWSSLNLQPCVTGPRNSNDEWAQLPFDNDRVTGSDPSVTDYILEPPAKCPNCRREILEKTLIEPA